MLRSAIVGVLALAAGLLSAPTAQAAPTQVIAIGDSYMAGIGAGTYVETDGCRRSSRSYAADAARRTRSSFTDLSCPGATVPEVLAQARDVPVAASIVLVQVGGNDVGFGSLAFSCLVPGGTNCLADVAAATAQLPALSDGLGEIAAEIRTRAPRARIAFVGYPGLLSSVRQCASSSLGGLIDAKEAAAIIDLQDALDATIDTAAQTTGASYLDWPRSVHSHSLCSSDPWFVTFQPPQDALHPTSRAYSAMGRPVAALIRG